MKPYTYIPDVQQRTTGNDSARSQVFALLLLAFVINGASKMSEVEGKTKTEKFLKSMAQNNLPAWAILTVVLVMASDFPTAQNLAVAFSLLIFLASLILNGEKSMNVFNNFVKNYKAPGGKK